LKTLTAIAIIGSLLTTNAFAAPSAKAAKVEKTKIVEFKSAQEGFDTRTFFYITSKEVIAIDAQFTPKLAEDSIAHLRTFTDKPITTLIITHPNPDKFNGASVFRKLGAKIIASEATAKAITGVHQYKQHYFIEMAKMFTKETYPQPVEVDTTFGNEKMLTLQDNDTLELIVLKAPGVSNTQTVIFSKSQNALFVGDLIHHKAHAWLEGGILNGKPVPSITGWIKNLEQIEFYLKSNPTVYGGRGIQAPLKVATQEQIAYLNKSVKIVKDMIAKTKLTSKDIGTNKAAKFYTELEAKFKTEFPDYELPYMIQFGSYGLVQDLLQ
jgi:glyoxylase-like metal-dependent hydrolase (beta-lactamase superfamily II)